MSQLNHELGSQTEFKDLHLMTSRKSSFTYDEILTCSHGQMFGPGNAQLPLPRC